MFTSKNTNSGSLSTALTVAIYLSYFAAYNGRRIILDSGYIHAGMTNTPVSDKEQLTLTTEV